jgi:hypothetical protein
MTFVMVFVMAACSYWGVGQLADRRTVNPEVGGSSPPAPASKVLSGFLKTDFAGD